MVIQAGDLLVYNAGVVHDEISGPDMEVGSYCVAVGGLHMPGLRENALIPDDAGYVFPTGKYFNDLKALFEMMFRNLAAGGAAGGAVLQHADARTAGGCPHRDGQREHPQGKAGGRAAYPRTAY